MLQVPELLKTALIILYGNCSPEEIRALLPIKLGAIREVANACQREANTVLEEFDQVIETLTELQCSTMEMQGKTEEAKERATAKAKIEAEEKQRLENRKLETEQKVEELTKQVKEAREDWKTALDSMPSGAELIGYAIADGVGQLIGSLANFVGGKSGESTNQSGHPTVSSTNASTGQQGSAGSDDEMRLISTMNIVSTHLMNLEKYFEIGGQAKATGWSANLDKEKIATILAHLEKLQERNSRMVASQDTKKFGEILQLSVSTANGMMKQPLGQSAIQGHFDDLQKCLSESSFLQSEWKKRSGQSQFHRPGPQMNDPTPQPQNSGLVGAAVQRAHIKVEMTRAELKSLRESKEEATRQQLQVQRDLADTMRKLEEFEHIKANSAEILQVIQQGVTAFAELKSQWKELQMFFDSMAKLIEASLSPRMNEFVAQAETMQSIQPSPQSKEIVYQAAYQAAKVGYVVNHLSDSYCAISKDHLMPLTIKLDRLISLDKVRDSEQIQREKTSLGYEARAAQGKITAIIQSKHAAFERSAAERMNAIDLEMKKLPPIPSNEIQAIRQRAEESVDKINKEQQAELEDFC